MNKGADVNIIKCVFNQVKIDIKNSGHFWKETGKGIFASGGVVSIAVGFIFWLQFVCDKLNAMSVSFPIAVLALLLLCFVVPGLVVMSIVYIYGVVETCMMIAKIRRNK
jgi:hypothetical protein